MALELKIHDVINEETYIDRDGNSHPNQEGGKSIYVLNRLSDYFIGVLSELYPVVLEKEEPFLAACAPINRLIIEAPPSIDKDSTLANFVYSPTSGLTMVDFERLKLMPIQISLVRILEYKGIEYMTEKERDSILEKTIRKLEQSQALAIDRDLFFQVYFASSIFNHLTVVGYTTTPGKPAKANLGLDLSAPTINLELIKEREAHFKLAQRSSERLLSSGLDQEESGKIDSLCSIIDDVRSIISSRVYAAATQSTLPQ